MNKVYLYASYAVVGLSIFAWIVSLSGWFAHANLPPATEHGLQAVSFLWIPTLIAVAVFRRRVARATEK